MNNLLLLPVTLVLAIPANGQEPPREEGAMHVGPVSGVVAHDGANISCSRAGIFVARKDGARKLEVPRFRVFDFALRGELLVAVGGRPGQTGEVACIRGLEREVAHWKAGSDVVYAVAIAADGTRAALGLASGRVFEVDLPKLDARRELTKHSAACRAVAYHGERLVTAGLDGNLNLYGKDRTPRVVAAHTAGIDCLLFDADGERVLSGARDGRVRVHSFASGRLMRTYQRLGDRVNALSTDPAGSGWLAGLRDGKICRLAGDAATALPVCEFDAPVHALSRDGSRVLVGLRGAMAAIERPIPHRGTKTRKTPVR